jgi:hypothetical protein
LNEKIFVILINIIKLTQSANKAALWDTKKIYQVSPKAKTERRTSFLLFLKNNHPLYTTSYQWSFDRPIKTPQMARTNRFQKHDWVVKFFNNHRPPFQVG